MPATPIAARAALHFGEEPCISGTRGSGTVFFSGCTLRCVFCQNQSISQQKIGKSITIERLADIFRELEQSGAHNINLVNPTHYAVSICKALELYRPNVPVLYNSSGYERVETLKMLDGLIDVYLPDCKYVHNDIAKLLSGVDDYFEHASSAILEMARQTGPATLDENGIIRKGTIVRHLVLPGHTRESMAVLDWLALHKDTLWISLMFQYTPMGNINEFKELQRPLTSRECAKVWDYMNSLGIHNGYVQSRQSSGKGMIPAFDLTGV
jgi:putative pyruvate formate lyase activating enzyme